MNGLLHGSYKQHTCNELWHTLYRDYSDEGLKHDLYSCYRLLPRLFLLYNGQLKQTKIARVT